MLINIIKDSEEFNRKNGPAIGDSVGEGVIRFVNLCQDN
jgi:hypothetical protein